MAELTINTLIKMIIILVVIIVVAISLFLLWQNYLKPYFLQLGKEVGGALILIKAKKESFKNINNLKL